MLVLLQALDNNGSPYVGPLNNYEVNVDRLDDLYTTFAYKAMKSWLESNEHISMYNVINKSSVNEPILMVVEK